MPRPATRAGAVAEAGGALVAVRGSAATPAVAATGTAGSGRA